MDDLRKKNIIYTIVLLAAIVVVWLIRDRDTLSNDLRKVELRGATMGTTYQVKYLAADPINFQPQIDSILEQINLCLSTYIDNSEISQFNRGTLLKYERPFFHDMLVKSRRIHQATEGAYDPTVMPLVNAWGFGPDQPQTPTSFQVDSLLQTVGFDSIFYDELAVCKLQPNAQLDFSAIAKGYAVDVIQEYLQSQGLENSFVEIGGEISARGLNQEGENWAIYIEKPLEQSRSVQAMVTLNNQAIATSGNYRNFYLKDGKKYAHTISPFTGYPVQHDLLSVSVFASSCATADAFATAFMVLGREKALKIVEADDDLEAYFIYSGTNGEIQTLATPGIKNHIVE